MRRCKSGKKGDLRRLSSLVLKQLQPCFPMSCAVFQFLRRIMSLFGNAPRCSSVGACKKNNISSLMKNTSTCVHGEGATWIHEGCAALGSVEGTTIDTASEDSARQVVE